MTVTPEEIDALLPQTQCQECGYAACLPYATAIARGEVDIAQCAPGGVATLETLAKLMHIDATPYYNTVKTRYRSPSVAVIDESFCIGCVKCIAACPVDAIIGSGKMMHTVLPDVCTGCELCVAPCPTDCITMVAVESIIDKKTAANNARHHYETKNNRLQKIRDNKVATVSSETTQAQLNYIEAARLRVLAKKGPPHAEK